MGGMLIVNGKNYENPGFTLQKSIVGFVQELNDDRLFFAPNFSTLFSSKFKKGLIGQSVYPNTDKGTGNVTLNNLIQSGVGVSLLNHSENRIDFKIIKKVLEESNGFKIVLCAESLSEVKKFSKLSPFKIAYEPPELIGGDVSVSSSKPKIIQRAVLAYPELLVGAGVKTVEDVKKCLELGAKGVLVSSGVMKTNDPGFLIKNFLEVLK